MKILLKDLDEYKVRNLKKAQQTAFIRRRSDFFEEKVAFLNFFSFKLISEGLSIFDYNFIKDQTKSFFSEIYKDGASRQIIEELSHSTSDNPNFPAQLIFSGIFTTVSSISSQVSYDFPHRRFREVLAIKYLENHNKLDELLCLITNPTLTEFIILVFITKEEFRNKIIQSLLDEFKANKNYNIANTIMYECIIKTDFEITDLIELNIQNWISLNDPIKISNKVLSFCKFNPSFIRTLEDKFPSIDSEHLNSLNLIITILNYTNETELKERCIKNLQKTESNNRFLQKILLFKTLFESINKNKTLEEFNYLSNKEIVIQLIHFIKAKSNEEKELNSDWIKGLTNDQKKEIILTDKFNSRIPSQLISIILSDNLFLELLTFKEKIFVICNRNYINYINISFLSSFLQYPQVLETISVSQCEYISKVIDSNIYEKKIGDFFIANDIAIRKLNINDRLALIIGLYRTTKTIEDKINKTLLGDFENYLMNIGIYESIQISNAIKQLTPEIDNYLFDNYIVYAYVCIFRDRLPNETHSGLSESAFVSELKSIVLEPGAKKVVLSRRERLNLRIPSYIGFYKQLYDIIIELIPTKISKEMSNLTKSQVESENKIKYMSFEEVKKMIDTQKYDTSFLEPVLLV